MSRSTPDETGRERRERARAEGRHPAPLNEGRSRNMQANRRADTKPEVDLRRRLHALGYRFRKDLRLEANGVRARPDVVFTRRKVAIFVDGCFWHCCPEHGRAPTVNQWYWDDKLARNRDRDAKQAAALAATGWTVVRLWEHDCPEPAIARVLEALQTQTD